MQYGIWKILRYGKKLIERIKVNKIKVLTSGIKIG